MKQGIFEYFFNRKSLNRDLSLHDIMTKLCHSRMWQGSLACISCADPETSVLTMFFYFSYGGVGVVINVFHRWPYGPHSNANVTEKVGAHPDNVLLFLFSMSSTYISQRFVTGLPQQAIGPEGPNCFSSGVVPVFIKKPIATCYFSGGRGLCPPVPPPPLDPHMHIYQIRNLSGLFPAIKHFPRSYSWA